MVELEGKCKGKTKSGAPCKIWAGDKEYCDIHADQKPKKEMPLQTVFLKGGKIWNTAVGAGALSLVGIAFAWWNYSAQNGSKSEQISQLQVENKQIASEKEKLASSLGRMKYKIQAGELYLGNTEADAAAMKILAMIEHEVRLAESGASKDDQALIASAHAANRKGEYRRALELVTDETLLSIRLRVPELEVKALGASLIAKQALGEYESALPYARRLAELHPEYVFVFLKFQQMLTDAGDAAEKAREIIGPHIDQSNEKHLDALVSVEIGSALTSVGKDWLKTCDANSIRDTLAKFDELEVWWDKEFEGASETTRTSALFRILTYRAALERRFDPFAAYATSKKALELCMEGDVSWVGNHRSLLESNMIMHSQLTQLGAFKDPQSDWRTRGNIQAGYFDIGEMLSTRLNHQSRIEDHSQVVGREKLVYGALSFELARWYMAHGKMDEGINQLLEIEAELSDFNYKENKSFTGGINFPILLPLYHGVVLFEKKRYQKSEGRFDRFLELMTELDSITDYSDEIVPTISEFDRVAARCYKVLCMLDNLAYSKDEIVDQLDRIKLHIERAKEMDLPSVVSGHSLRICIKALQKTNDPWLVFKSKEVIRAFLARRAPRLLNSTVYLELESVLDVGLSRTSVADRTDE